MRTFTNFFLFIIFFIFLNFNICYAEITFVDGHWETSFDCAEWTGPESRGDIGCGLDRWGNLSVTGDTDTYYDQITTAANYNEGGSGIRGLRQWVIGTGNPLVSTGAYTLGKRIEFPAAQSELWMRWYMRYEAGFHFFGDGDIGGEKLVYFKPKGGLGTSLTFIAGYGINQNYEWGNNTGGNDKTTKGVDDFFGDPSTGKWVCIEIHYKVESSSGATDGIVQMWVDDELIIDNKTADTKVKSEGEEIWQVDVQHNIHGLPDFDAKYIDFDDIVIYNTTPPNRDAQGNPYIGPLTSIPATDTPTPLPAPADLNVIPSE